MGRSSRGDKFRQLQAAVKPYVRFETDYRKAGISAKSMRAKVRRYFDLIYGAKGEPGLFNPATDVPIASKSTKRLRLIQESEGQPFHRQIKVAFVESVADPSNPGKLLKPRIKVKGGKVIKATFDIAQTFFPFRPFPLNAIDDDDMVESFLRKECARILKMAPDVLSWSVKCGRRQTESPRSRTGIVDYVLYLLHGYSNATQWLRGLVAIEFSTRLALQEFTDSRKALRKRKRGRKL